MPGTIGGSISSALGGAADKSSSAYRKAVQLNPEHPWWNGRFITHLIESGRPKEAQVEWKRAIERVDPEGAQVRESPWLAHNLHMWVCRAWIRTGRYERARSVLRLVPRRFTSRSPLSQLRRRAETGSVRWERFLANLETRCSVGACHAQEVRSRWTELEQAQTDLPLPLADKVGDEKTFQFAWSYSSILLEIDVDEAGDIYWFGKDRDSGECEDGSVSKGAEIPPQLRSWLDKVARA